MSPRILLAGPKLQPLVPFADDMTERGYEVRSATTGLGCLAILRNWRPNLLVMNPDLTWGSGIGVLGVMYEDTSIPSIPIVLLVEDPVRTRGELNLVEKAVRMKTERHLALNCRMLRQPVSSHDLLEVVDELFLQPQHAYICEKSTTESATFD